jgi:hypothetical protein
MSYAAGFLSMVGIFKSGGYWQGSMGGFVAASIVHRGINLLPISNLTLSGCLNGDSLASSLSWFFLCPLRRELQSLSSLRTPVMLDVSSLLYCGKPTLMIAFKQHD